MTRLLSIGLLLVFLFQLAGYHIALKIKQTAIRHEVKILIRKGIPEESLTLLKIPAALIKNPEKHFHWIHDDEFRYYGKLYDIVRQENHGDTTWYWCYPDEPETKFFAGMTNLIREANSKNKNQDKQQDQTGKWFPHFTINDNRLKSPAGTEHDKHCTPYSFVSLPWIIAPPLPPPKNV